MKIKHMSAEAGVQALVSSFRENGYVVIDRLAPDSMMDAIETELEPYFDSAPYGHLPELGFHTQRVGSLIERSKTIRELILQDTYIATVGALFSHSTQFQLSLTEINSIAPGAEAQFLHQDEMLFDRFPFPVEYDVFINSLWALTDFSEDMGATRVVPGSHRAGAGARFSQNESLPVEMARGSVMIFSGKIYHGGGANLSGRVRRAIDIGFSAGWVRQVENQYLSCSMDTARELPPELARLMGYESTGGYGLIGNRENAMKALERP